MKKIILIMGAMLLLTACSPEVTYNEEVERYEKIIFTDSVKIAEKLEESEEADFREAIYELDEEVKELERKITKDGKITKDELAKYTKLINKVEDAINEYK